MTVKRRLVVPLLALALGLAGCSGAKATPGVATAGGGTPSASPTGSVPDDDKARRFAQCMREHGIELPDPKPGDKAGVGLVGVDKDKLLGAVDACREFMPDGGENVKTNPEDLDRQRVLAKCMRDNGVADFPDPDPNGGGAVRDYILDKHDDDVLAALEKCRDVAPAPTDRPERGK